MDVTIRRSKKPEKKFDALIDGRTISFGAKGMSDFTIHKDPERKKRYIQRHKANENWNDPKTAGFYSRWILWEKPTLQEAVANVNKKFKVKVKLK